MVDAHNAANAGITASNQREGGGAPRALGKMVAGNILLTAARRFRDREAIFCTSTNRRFSFRQLNERCNRLASALAGFGLEKPDVVGFLCNNRAELPEIYFALGKLGLVGIPLNYRLASSEIVALMRAMGARSMLFETRFASAADQVRAALPAVETFVAIGAGGPSWALDYEALLARASGDEPEAEVEEDDLFYFNLTSGTTGLPKSYALTQFNNAALGSMFEAYDMTSRDVVLTAFPAFGRVGYAWLAAGLMFGARNVLMDFHPGEALRLIEAERVTMCNLVPTMAAMMLGDAGLPSRDLRSLRALVFAGAMFPAPLRERVTARLCPGIYEYYGMQETGALTISTPSDRALYPESVGAPLCFAEVRIERLDGTLAAPGEIGEIVGRSPATVTRYFDNPQKSAETFRDGWVHTGDLGAMNEDGFVFIKGRLKDMIISGGQNVHAAEVEETILRIPGVADCAVFGLPDDLWGERVAAVIVKAPSGGQALTLEGVLSSCREHLAGFKTPKTVVFQDEPLPRTPTGKVQKFLLVDRFREPGKG
jgi:acyl-CoA synthetase (AMP-forming)/AMP-acid ligase II